MLDLEIVCLFEYLIRCDIRVILKVSADIVFNCDEGLACRQRGDRPEAKPLVNNVAETMERVISQVRTSYDPVPLTEEKPKVGGFVIPRSYYEGDWHRSELVWIGCSLRLVKACWGSVRGWRNDEYCDFTVAKCSQLIKVPASATRVIDETPDPYAIALEAL